MFYCLTVHNDEYSLLPVQRFRGSTARPGAVDGCDFERVCQVQHTNRCRCRDLRERGYLGILTLARTPNYLLQHHRVALFGLRAGPTK